MTMILAVDIGNTHTVFGIYDKKKLLGDWRVTSFVSRTEDEFGALVRTFCDDAHITVKKISAVGISSVVPNLTDVMQRMSKKYFSVEPIVVSARPFLWGSRSLLTTLRRSAPTGSATRSQDLPNIKGRS